MRLAFAAGIATLALSGCMTDMGPQSDALARVAAKGVVNSVVQTKFPGVDAAPVTDCIIDNASGPEIVTIAQAAVVGMTPATNDLVVRIAQRPDTLRCTASNVFGVSL